MKSIAELGRMFALLDGSLRELLAATLDGWQPPQVVVVGEESSGKSSVLQRLMMTPLLPRGKTFGVFTFCDELNQRNAPRLKQWVRNGQGAVVLDPYGW